jgi:uncharacterized membrane protein
MKNQTEYLENKWKKSFKFLITISIGLVVLGLIGFLVGYTYQPLQPISLFLMISGFLLGLVICGGYFKRVYWMPNIDIPLDKQEIEVKEKDKIELRIILFQTT